MDRLMLTACAGGLWISLDIIKAVILRQSPDFSITLHLLMGFGAAAVTMP